MKTLSQPGTPEHPVEANPRLKDMGDAAAVIKLWQDAARARQPQPAPEPTGPRWWEEPDAVRPPYYRRNDRFLMVAGPMEYIFVTPGPEPRDWLSERDEWGRIVTHSYDPDLAFRAWLAGVKHNGFSRGFEPQKAHPSEEALRRNTAHDPDWEALLRSRFGMPKPPTRLEGQLFDPGPIYKDMLMSSKFNIIDASEFLVRHIMGDHGQHGRHGDVTPTALDRACVAAALVPARNALAIEAGVGLVMSEYSIKVEGLGMVPIYVRTLLKADGSTTGIGHGF